jgi:hypothetical protein
MRPENQKMKQYLSENGIDVMPKFIWDGSLKGTWRLYNRNLVWHDNTPLWEKLTSLGFKDYNGDPLSWLSGNGGLFSVFARFDRTKEFLPVCRVTPN